MVLNRWYCLFYLFFSRLYVRILILVIYPPSPSLLSSSPIHPDFEFLFSRLQKKEIFFSRLQKKEFGAFTQSREP